jgi:biotin-dependent carboxylase-like uncharacterized protein
MHIISPGLFTTIQDEGRIAYQHWGVPVSGAMDRYSLNLANALVGNPWSEACLEMTFTGPTIRFESDAWIALTGGTGQFTVDDKVIQPYASHLIKKDQTLAIGKITNGIRTYLSVAGGLNVPAVMGSKSTYLRGTMGGFEGRALKAGDSIELVSSHKGVSSRRLDPEFVPVFKDQSELRILPGPEVDRFSVDGIFRFLTEQYTISPQSDRMGYRLKGPAIEQTDKKADICSSPISFGTVQVPKGGLPIIMMADRQTCGGYTRIANVISADHHLLAQLKPGDKVGFREVNLEQAHQLLKEQRERILSVCKG